jgi:hypothetical protein
MAIPVGFKPIRHMQIKGLFYCLLIILIMDNTILIQVTNPKAFRLLQELEELNLIKLVKENITPVTTKLSDKYKGVFSEEDAKSFDKHTLNMRKEWDNT